MAATTLVLVATAVALSATVTQQYTPADGDTPAMYTFHIAVAPGEKLRDIHIIAAKGKKLKVGAASGVSVTPTAGGDSSSRSGWNSPNHGSGATTRDLNWSTEDDDSGEPGDEDTTDDPVEGGNTASVTVECGAGSKTGSVYCIPTFNGSDDPPPVPGGTPTYPGPVACVTPNPGNRMPTAASTVPLAFESTEPGTEWRVYVAASLSDPENPATDPLGIGIDINDAPPAGWGIATVPNFGVFAPPPPEQFPVAETQVSVGAAPVGSRFWIVVVGRRDGEIELFTDPVEYTVSAP